MKYSLIFVIPSFANLVSYQASAADAIHEPPPVFYGTVIQSPANTEVSPVNVEWQVETNGDSATITATRIVTVEGTTYYISQIPFETRRLADDTPLTPTPDTLEQTRTDTSYTRSAKVDGRTALVPTGKETFSYGVPSMGLIERIDLVIGETYAEWAERVLGEADADPTGDPDRDGFANEQEYRAGTDPQSGHSYPRVSLAPAPGGSFTLSFPTVIGQRYRIERTTTLAEPDWVQVGESIPGNGELRSIVDTTSAPRLFYRIRPVVEGEGG